MSVEELAGSSVLRFDEVELPSYVQQSSSPLKDLGSPKAYKMNECLVLLYEPINPVEIPEPYHPLSDEAALEGWGASVIHKHRLPRAYELETARTLVPKWDALGWASWIDEKGQGEPYRITMIPVVPADPWHYSMRKRLPDFAPSRPSWWHTLERLELSKYQEVLSAGVVDTPHDYVFLRMYSFPYLRKDRTQTQATIIDICGLEVGPHIYERVVASSPRDPLEGWGM